MKKYIVFLFVIFCTVDQAWSSGTYLMDSLGMTKKDGRDFIIHEVQAGETLYALSRKYGVDVQQIKDANPGSLDGLSIGQKVLIPYQKKKEVGEGDLHTVKSSETLFSISRLYNVRVDDLKRWNNLSDNNISLGQRLVVRGNLPAQPEKEQKAPDFSSGRKTHTVKQSQTLYSISRMYGVSTGQLREWNQLESDVLDIGQTLFVSSKNQTVRDDSSNSSMLPVTKNNKEDKIEPEIADAAPPGEAVPDKPVAPKIIDSTDDEVDVIEKPVEKITQKGLAEVIENTSDTKKYLALHREAPVGTIMQVRNEMNDQSVFVRIVGPIPPTGDNSKVILKISKKAYDRLGAVDARFPVEISYIP